MSDNNQVERYRSYNDQIEILKKISIKDDDQDFLEIKQTINSILNENSDDIQTDLIQEKNEDDDETKVPEQEVQVDLNHKAEIEENQIKYLEKKLEAKKKEIAELKKKNMNEEVKFITSLRNIRDRLIKEIENRKKNS